MQVLHADFVERAHQSAFEERSKTLDGIRVDIPRIATALVLKVYVLHCLVSVLLAHSLVTLSFVADCRLSRIRYP